MSETPVHDWVRPRLHALVQEAIAAGYDPVTVTAVVTDLVASTDLTEPDPGGTA